MSRETREERTEVERVHLEVSRPLAAGLLEQDRLSQPSKGVGSGDKKLERAQETDG